MHKHTILHFDSIDSTNAKASELATEQKLVEGSVIVTNDQTNGRGMDTNSWESESGMNLTMSMVLYPRFLPAGQQFMLSKVISLGVCKTVSDILPEGRVTIKWPNDIYIDEQKVAGTLIQNSILGQVLESSIAGIGLNVNQLVFRSVAPNPVSLKMITGKEYDLDFILEILITNIKFYYEILKSGRFDELDKFYLSHFYRMNVVSKFRKEGKIIQARITGITEYGYLKLESTEGICYECEIKEVEFII